MGIDQILQCSLLRRRQPPGRVIGIGLSQQPFKALLLLVHRRLQPWHGTRVNDKAQCRLLVHEAAHCCIRTPIPLGGTAGLASHRHWHRAAVGRKHPVQSGFQFLGVAASFGFHEQTVVEVEHLEPARMESRPPHERIVGHADLEQVFRTRCRQDVEEGAATVVVLRSRALGGIREGFMCQGRRHVQVFNPLRLTRCDPDRQPIPMPTAGEDMLADYALVGTTLGRHPLSLIRPQLKARSCRRSSELANLPHGRNVRFAGLVTMRQRPQIAKGVTFVTLEDEDGMVNALAWQDVAERQRQVLLGSRLLAIDARLERVDDVQHLIINRMEDYTSMLAGLHPRSRDFH